MKKLIACVFLLLISHSVLAQQKGTKTDSFEAANLGELSISINSGMNITVEGVEGATDISYTYNFDGNKQAYRRYFEGFEPIYTKNGGTASIVIEFPKKKGIPIYVTKQNDLIVTVPKNLKFEIDTKYSTISITNIGKKTGVINRSGTVTISNIDEGVRVDNDYGDVKVSDIMGSLDIRGRSAGITVRNITGDAKIEALYSKMNIGDVDGDLILKNQSGVINAFNIKGSMTSESNYSDHEITDVDGDIDIKSKSGKVSVDGTRSLTFNGDFTSVTAKNITGIKGVNIASRSSKIDIEKIAGPAEISGQYMTIKLEDIKGSVSIENKSGKVTAQNINGESFVMRAEYAPLVLKDFYGSELSVTNKSADITIEGTTSLNSIDIESQHGDVYLTAPGFSGDVALSSTHGKIQSDFNIEGKIVRERNSNNFQGKIGEGSSSMSITVRSGSIKLKKN